MKNLIYMVYTLAILVSCSTSKENVNETKTADSTYESNKAITIEDENEDTEFKVIVFDSGFQPWLAANAKPRGYYSQSFLSERNRLMVIEWNIRAGQPLIYDSNLYSMTIDYDPKENYDYETDYLLYNYFIYFQIRYNQQLSGFTPRP